MQQQQRTYHRQMAADTGTKQNVGQQASSLSGHTSQRQEDSFQDHHRPDGYKINHDTLNSPPRQGMKDKQSANNTANLTQRSKSSPKLIGKSQYIAQSVSHPIQLLSQPDEKVQLRVISKTKVKGLQSIFSNNLHVLPRNSITIQSNNHAEQNAAAQGENTQNNNNDQGQIQQQYKMKKNDHDINYPQYPGKVVENNFVKLTSSNSLLSQNQSNNVLRPHRTIDNSVRAAINKSQVAQNRSMNGSNVRSQQALLQQPRQFQVPTSANASFTAAPNQQPSSFSQYNNQKTSLSSQKASVRHVTKLKAQKFLAAQQVPPPQQQQVAGQVVEQESASEQQNLFDVPQAQQPRQIQSNEQDPHQKQQHQINNINASQQDIHIHLNYNGGQARNFVVDASLFQPAAASNKATGAESFDDSKSGGGFGEVILGRPNQNNQRTSLGQYQPVGGRHQPSKSNYSNVSKSINVSAISQGSSTLGGPADKYRQAFLIDKPAQKREKQREREMQLEKELRACRQRCKQLEEFSFQFKEDYEDLIKSLNKKKDAEAKETKITIEELNRQIDQLNEKNIDFESEIKTERTQLRVAKAHIESLVRVTTGILEHIVTKCQIHIADGRSRSQNMSQISDNYGGGTSQLSSSTDQFDRSYEDERRNLVNSIQSILLAKLQTVQKTLPDVELSEHLKSVKSWKFDWCHLSNSHNNRSQLQNKQPSAVSQQFLSPLTQTQRTQQFMQRSDSRNSLSMYTSQRDTMSNLFTQQQHSFYSKENTGRIGYFGPKQDQTAAEQENNVGGGGGGDPNVVHQPIEKDKQIIGGKSECGNDNKWPPLGRFNSLSSNQNENNGDAIMINDDSQLTPAPSFGKMSNDQHDDVNSKSYGRAASDYTGGRGMHVGTTSSISGSVGGVDKGWSEQKPSYLVNGGGSKHDHDNNQKKQSALAMELGAKLDQMPQPQQLTPKGLGSKANFTLQQNEDFQNDSVTNIKATTDLGNISFEQHQEQTGSQPDYINEAHYQKEDTAKLRDFDPRRELATQVNKRRQLSKTPDASQEKNFNNKILFNQSFSADLEMVNAPAAQLPVFDDEEPITFSEPIESDDEQSLLDNFGGGSHHPLTTGTAKQRYKDMETSKQTAAMAPQKSHQQMVISYQEASSAHKLRRLSEEAGPLSQGSSFGANDLGNANNRSRQQKGLIQIKSIQDDPLQSLLFGEVAQRLSKNKSQICGPKKALSGFANSENKSAIDINNGACYMMQAKGRRSQGSLNLTETQRKRCFSDMRSGGDLNLSSHNQSGQFDDDTNNKKAIDNTMSAINNQKEKQQVSSNNN